MCLAITLGPIARSRRPTSLSAAADPHAHPLTGVALKVLSTIAFTGMATLVKLVAGRYPLGEITFFRSFFAFVPVLAWVVWRGQLRGLFATDNLAGHLGRSFAGASAMLLGFSALAYLPLADATAIGYAAPLMTVVLASFVLGEVVRVYRWTAVAVGFLGVLLIVADYAGLVGGQQPQGSLFGAGLQVGAAFCSALAVIQIRRLALTENPATIVVYFTAITSAIGLATLPFGWTLPAPGDALILVGAGLLGGIGQVLMTQSFRYAEASVLAPFDYLSMIWALAIGVIVFQALPTPMMLAGTAIIVAAGLLVGYREHVLGLERRQAREVQSPPPPMI